MYQARLPGLGPLPRSNEDCIGNDEGQKPLARFQLRTGQVLAVVVLGLIFFRLNFLPLGNTDTWGHLAFGRWIVTHQQLPQGNPFCPMANVQTSANPYCWLSQTFFYSIYHLGEWLAGGDTFQKMAGGVDLLRFTHALIVLTRLVFLLLACQRLTGSLRLALIGLAVYFLITLGGLSIYIFRPQTLGEMCFAILLFIISRAPISRAAMVGVPVLLTVWANLHGSYSLGLAVLGLCLVGNTISVGRDLQTWNLRQILGSTRVRRLGITLALSLLAIALLNPSGPWIFWNALAMSSHPVTSKMIEWQPIRLELAFGPQYLYALAVIVVAGALIYARGRISATALLLLLFFGLLPFRHIRAIIWLQNLLPWVVASLLVSRQTAWESRMFLSRSMPSIRKTMVAIIVVMLCYLVSIPSTWLAQGRPRPLEATMHSGTPWQLAFQLQGEHPNIQPWLPELDQWLQHHYPQGRFQGAIFTTEETGEFLVWSLPQEMSVTWYGHVHLFSERHWQVCRAVRSGSRYWRSVVDQLQINMLVVPSATHEKLRNRLRRDQEWQILVTDKPEFLLAIRKNPI